AVAAARIFERDTLGTLTHSAPVPALPAALRRLVPDRVRDDVRLRAVSVGLGAIPPRALHSAEDVALLRSLARGCARVVEIGVYEGASAVVLCEELDPSAELHLIDPFGEQPGALRRGWAATEWATRRVVARACRDGASSPRVVWHVGFSADVARGWPPGAPVDLVFVDGDHLEPGVRLDWELWSPLVAPGGHVLFHDARLGRPEGRGLPGPTAVVDALFRAPAAAAPDWEIVAEIDRCVAVRRRRP
ncbi:MAG: class I SAM-dependent methyltransferase, partial [Actinomycetota bacterium]|nr:class I SAM-dependent methyltransferase [Actinomycetota bacterium]